VAVYANLLLRCTINILLKFIILYFNPLNAELNPIRHLLAFVGAHHVVDVSRIRVHNFMFLKPGNLYVILAKHNEFPDDDVLNAETCSSMLFVIVVFNITVQSLVKL
jgi:hypothetical protein